MTGSPSLAHVVLAAMTVQLYSVFAMLVPSVLGPSATASLGIAPQSIGYFFALQNIASMLCCLMLTGVSRRHGALRASQIATLLSALGTAACAIGSIPALVVATLVIGIGTGLVSPASAVLLAGSAPPARLNLVFSIKQAIVPVAAALAGLALPPMLEWTDWRGAMLISGFAGLAFALAIQPLRAAVDRQPDARAPLWQLNPLRNLGLLARVPALRVSAATAFIYNGAQQVVWIYFVSFLHLELGWTLAAAGGSFAISQASAVLARIVWGWIADRIRDPFRVLAIIGIGTAACIGLLATLDRSSPHGIVWLLALGCGATASGWNGVHLASIARFSPREELPAATGAVQLFAFFGATLAPMLFALVVSATGRYAITFLGFALLPITGSTLLLFWTRRMRSAKSAVTA